MIENPQPAILFLLLLALPGVVAVATALAHRMPSEKDIAVVLVPGIALALVLLSVHVLGRFFRSLASGLTIRNKMAISSTSTTDPSQRGRMAVATLIDVGLIAPATIFYNFHDEIPYAGHQAIIAHLQNDIYPRRFMFAPEYELRLPVRFRPSSGNSDDYHPAYKWIKRSTS